MSKYFFDFRPDFNLFNSDTKRATTIYYTASNPQLRAYMIQKRK